MVKLTESELRQIGFQARPRTGLIAGKCYPICKRVIEGLYQAGVPRTESIEPSQVYIGSENHNVIFLPNKYVSGVTSGDILIDASADQFCDENVNKGLVTVSLGERETISKVRVLPVDSKKRKAEYSSTRQERL